VAVNYDVYLAIVLTGLFVSIGSAISEIWIKPWLKKLKRKHERLIKKLRANSRGRFYP
jgi:hypothetical protein